MAKYTFPRVTFNSKDSSATTSITKTVTPLHKPLFMGFAAKGPVGVPQWNDMAGHSRMFGTEMFSTSSDYAKTLPFYYVNLAAKSQKFYYLRLPDGSDTLGFAIFAIASTVKDAPVYQADPSTGVDQTVQEQDASGNPKVADQTQYTFVLYPISSNNPLTVAAVSKYFGIDPVAAPTTLYLMLSILGTSPGNYMTRNAISLDVETPATDQATLINRLGAPLIRFYPRYCSDDSFSYLSTQMTGQNYNYSSVQNVSTTSYVDFCPTMESVVDSASSEDYGWQPVIDQDYNSASKGYLLDYDISVNIYGGTPMDQRGSVFNGTFALAMRMYNEFNTLVDPAFAPVTPTTMASTDYQNVNKINPFTGVNITGVQYLLQPLGKKLPSGALGGAKAKFGNYSNMFYYDSSAISSAKTVSDANIDAAVKAFFDPATGQTENLADPFAAPISHIYDPGYAFETKAALANILDVRDDVKIDWTTETYMATLSNNATVLPKWMSPTTPVRVPNTFTSTLSALMTLSNIVTTHGIDDEYGTQCYRGEIYPQSGVMTANGNTKIVIPTNYERLKQRLAYYSGPTVTGSPKGRPGNVLSSFDSLSWVPKTDDQKQLIWGKGANYATYADTNLLFFPDIRTSFSTETSLYSSGTYTDHAVFLKPIIREAWTYYVGLETPVSRLTSDIQKAIDTAAFQAFGSYFTTNTTVSMQDSNAEDDYTAVITTDCGGNMPDRIWKTILTAIRNAATTTTQS